MPSGHCDLHRVGARFQKINTAARPCPFRNDVDTSRGASEMVPGTGHRPNHPAPPSPADDFGRSQVRTSFLRTCVAEESNVSVHQLCRADTKRAAAFFRDITTRDLYLYRSLHCASSLIAGAILCTLPCHDLRHYSIHEDLLGPARRGNAFRQVGHVVQSPGAPLIRSHCRSARSASIAAFQAYFGQINAARMAYGQPTRLSALRLLTRMV